MRQVVHIATFPVQNEGELLSLNNIPFPCLWAISLDDDDDDEEY